MVRLFNSDPLTSTLVVQVPEIVEHAPRTRVMALNSIEKSCEQQDYDMASWSDYRVGAHSPAAL